MITVVNKKHHLQTPNDIYIGRPEILGNPYPVSMGREKCIAEYRKYFEHEMMTNVMFNHTIHKIAHRASVQDINLVCWCSPLSCHGDVIKEAVESIWKGKYHNVL